MTKIQEEMIRVDEEEADGKSSVSSKVAHGGDRRNLSKSTTMALEKNHPKLLDDGQRGVAYNSF